MYTVGRLAKKYGLSRSTLLYYDSIGVLSPSSRNPGDYREYGPEDIERLERIMLYRSAGLPLKDIKNVLDSPETGLKLVLETRLADISAEVDKLRRQQTMVLKLLDSGELPNNDSQMDRRTWTDLLSASGFSQQDMRRWHVEFEKTEPEKHLKFLQFLCIPKKEIDVIRSWSTTP